MKGLCAVSEEYCPDLLFSKDLNSKIKEVSELNKIKKQVSNQPNPRGGKAMRGRFGGSRGRGIGPKFPRKGLPSRPKPYDSKNGGSSKGTTSGKAQ